MLKLHAAWSARLKLRAESNKLRAEGNKLRAEVGILYAEGNRLYAESNKLRAEGNKLRAEGNKLRAEVGILYAEGNRLWAEAILAAYGNVSLSWTRNTEYGECTLENGDCYDIDQEATQLMRTLRND